VNSHEAEVTTAKIRLLDALSVAKERAMDLEARFPWADAPNDYVSPIGDLYDRMQREVINELTVTRESLHEHGVTVR